MPFPSPGTGATIFLGTPGLDQGPFSFWQLSRTGASCRLAVPGIGRHAEDENPQGARRKRFRVTATGKLKRSQAGKKHLNSHKTGKRKRQLRGSIDGGKHRGSKYIDADGRALS